MSSKEILVVDDSLLLRLTVKNAFDARGYQTTVLGSGEEALAEIRRRLPETFSLVILDVILTEMSGLEILKSLRSIPGYAEVPVVIVSVDSSVSTIKQALQLGAADFIRKPFKVEQLIQRVEKLMNPFRRDEAKLSKDFHKILRQEIERARRGKTSLTLILAQRGQASYDQTSKAAKVIRQKLREIDTVLPFGPSVLGIILPLTDNSGAEVVAGKLKTWFSTLDKEKWHLAMATFPADGNEDGELFKLVQKRLAEELTN